MEEVAKIRKESRRALRSEQARAQQAIMTVELMQGEKDHIEEHIETVGANIETLKKSQSDMKEELKVKNMTIRKLQQEVETLEAELEEYRNDKSFKSGNNDGNLDSKSKEINHLRERLKLASEEAEGLRDEVHNLKHSTEKLSRETKTLESSTKLKVERM